MKETTKTSRVSGYLEKIYRELNKDLFGGELEEPVITIRSTPFAYGHVTCGKVWRTKDCQRYELNIGAESLGRPIENIVSTMIHEMVHIYNLMHDIKDCSRGNTYHNKRFKAKAESVGLVIGYDKRIGYSVTSPSDELILYICDKGWNDVSINRGISIGRKGGFGEPDNDTSGGESDKPKGKTSSTRKYECPCCGLSVRATREVFIKCGACEEKMVVAV